MIQPIILLLISGGVCYCWFFLMHVDLQIKALQDRFDFLHHKIRPFLHALCGWIYSLDQTFVNYLSTLCATVAHERLAQVHVNNSRRAFLEKLANLQVDALGAVPQVTELVGIGFEVVLSRNNPMDNNFGVRLVLENSLGDVQNIGHDKIVVAFFDVQVVRANNDEP